MFNERIHSAYSDNIKKRNSYIIIVEGLGGSLGRNEIEKKNQNEEK